MGFKDFHCEMFEISFRLASEEIDIAKLLEALRISDEEATPDEDGDIVILRTFGSREPSTDYHGHLRVVLAKDNDSSVELRYHSDTIEIQNEEPPYIEDAGRWLAHFVSKEDAKGRINAAYSFGKSFVTNISLPFPLATSEKALTGASVTGISIQFPDEAPVDLGILQRASEQIYVSIFSTSNVRLREFDLLAELRRLAVTVDSLVRMQEPVDEVRSAEQTK
jgi:hypothetical protein